MKRYLLRLSDPVRAREYERSICACVCIIMRNCCIQGLTYWEQYMLYIGHHICARRSNNEEPHRRYNDSTQISDHLTFSHRKIWPSGVVAPSNCSSRRLIIPFNDSYTLPPRGDDDVPEDSGIPVDLEKVAIDGNRLHRDLPARKGAVQQHRHENLILNSVNTA
jgi:hypothetical protein